MQSKPGVRNYLDVCHYLSDLYRFRKVNESGFSYETWARELDLKSRSYLRMVVQGKRKITEQFVSLYIKRMLLDASDAEYFRILVDYSQSRTGEHKEYFGKKLSQLMRTNTFMTEVRESYEFASDPRLVRIKTLLGFADAALSEQKLAEVFDVSLEEMKERLSKLSDLDFIEKKQDKWKGKDANLKIPEDLGSFALKKFHTQSLKEAIEAQDLPTELRRFRTLIVGLNEAELKFVFAKINDFAQEIMSENTRDEILGRRLFQININVAPVTKKLKLMKIPDRLCSAQRVRVSVGRVF